MACAVQAAYSLLMWLPLCTFLLFVLHPDSVDCRCGKGGKKKDDDVVVIMMDQANLAADSSGGNFRRSSSAASSRLFRNPTSGSGSLSQTYLSSRPDVAAILARMGYGRGGKRMPSTVILKSPPPQLTKIETDESETEQQTEESSSSSSYY